ncbi:MAG: insecticidal toxin protein [Deltaproteobacteria bacterium]|nr:insecticidal toxin protein [Deltaproteobacteria bacterium]
MLEKKITNRASGAITQKVNFVFATSQTGADARVKFQTHFHPFADQLARRLAKGSIRSVLSVDDNPDASFLPQPLFDDGSLPPGGYQCTSLVPEESWPIKDLDFSNGGAYSVYNWELFFHIPIAIAVHLSRQQRFEEAQHWFHYVFDPTDESGAEAPERFWKAKPLKNTELDTIVDIVEELGGKSPNPDTLAAFNAWIDNPFRPHVVARKRPYAYNYKVVMAYLDNLIAWGDYLFREDTGESINEAMQMYVMAANILGEHPQAIPQDELARKKGKTYNELLGHVESYSEAVENGICYQPQFAKRQKSGYTIIDASGNESFYEVKQYRLFRILSFAPYFCLAKNDQILEYWDVVADRLFKIRNSLNIKGIFRQLPLFEPPIDPALLVRATAAGIDIGSVVAGLNQPLPLIRFRLLLQKAIEITQEVKSFGDKLLATLEKKDNESLAILRAKHERSVLKMSESVAYGQWQETIKAREGIERSFENAVRRYAYYERLLGRKEREIDIPELKELDSSELSRMKLELNEPALPTRSIEINLAKNVEDDRKVSRYEATELEKRKAAYKFRRQAGQEDLVASGLSMIPDFATAEAPNGVGVMTNIGGVHFANALSFLADATRMAADEKTFEADKASIMGRYERREQDWALQSNLAAGEITQTYKQLRAAQIREAVAKREWDNHKKKIENAEEIDRFLTDERKGKLTNLDFYTWMRREVQGLHSQCFDFAFDIAKKAERTFQHELGNSDETFIKYDYASGKEGLLAGDKLMLDLKRMEMAYHDLNEREYELTKHVSLLQIDPLALVRLRSTGRCEFSVPEEIFDFDGPGHYFRRIKSVAVSIPCVAGPYVGVNCRLTLQKSRIRTSPLLTDNQYGEIIEPGNEDPRFHTYRGAVQSIVTSTAQGDSGLFDTQLNDERYLPFEGSGVIGTWQLKLPGDPSNTNEPEPTQFDYNTISDVILHIRYTAREGGDRLGQGAIGHLRDLIHGLDDPRKKVPVTRLLSVRHEFPTAWAAHKAAETDADLTLPLKAEHYPFWSQRWIQNARVRELILIAKTDGKTLGTPFLRNVPVKGLWGYSVVSPEMSDPPAPADDITIPSLTNSMDDLWALVTWTAE